MQKGIAIFQYGGAWGLPYEGPLLSHFLIVVLTEFACATMSLIKSSFNSIKQIMSYEGRRAPRRFMDTEVTTFKSCWGAL